MDKNIEDLGAIKGKVLLFGGVYSNLQALDALIELADKEEILPENCICTGDIVGYCAQPEETVQRFKCWKAKSIAGNVEIQLREHAADCGCHFKKGSRCDGFSKQWYPFAQQKLSLDSVKFMKTLPHHIRFNYANKRVMVVHGSFFNVSEFIFKSTPWEQKHPNFTASSSDVIVAGHCGLPFHHKNKGKLWINPGVIGMPANNGKPSVWCAILNDANKKITCRHYAFNYNYKQTHALMSRETLPQQYAKTIVTGIWDNTEILPEQESHFQGIGINF